MIAWSDAETIEVGDEEYYADTIRKHHSSRRPRGGSSAQLDRPVDWLVQPGEPSRVSLDLRRFRRRPRADPPD